MGRPKNKKPDAAEPISFETFQKIGAFEIRSLKQDKPDCCFNSVRVRKYRVTVEPIHEPDSVIVKRLKALWADCDNWHNWDCLQNEAAKYGVELDMETVGKNRKKR